MTGPSAGDRSPRRLAWLTCCWRAARRAHAGFSGPFLFISAFLCGAVTGIGILLQNLRAPRFVVPFVQLAVLVELLSLFFLRDTLKFGLIPVKATALEFNQQMVNAMDSINRFSAPLPPDSHLTLFAASVISATGLLIHVIAVQLRQAALGRVAAADHVHGAGRDRARRTAGAAVRPAGARLHRAAVGGGPQQAQPLGPPDLRCLAPGRGRAGRGVRARARPAAGSV